MNNEWKKCPECKMEVIPKNQKIDFIDGFVLGCLAEIATWIFMGILLAFFSYFLKENAAYGLGMILAIVFII